MNQTNTVFITALSIILVGYFLKRQNIVSEKEGKIISKLLMHTTFPALMFLTMKRVHFEFNLLLLPVISFCFSLLTMFTAAKLFKNQSQKMKAILIMGSGGFNLGLFAYPLIEGIWGQAGMVYAAMFDFGNSFAVFGLVYGTGVFMSDKNEGVSISQNAQKAILKIFTLLPFQAILLGVFVNLVKIEIPTIVIDVIDVMARGNKVIVLLIMGIYLNISTSGEILKKVSKVLLIRYFWGFLLGFAFFYFLPVEQLYRNVLLIVLIIPVGMTILPFSDELNYDTKIAGMLVNVSMLISFAMMWALVIGLNLA
ncbi:AEC family transporter [Arcicella lustrica]|uniref:AEC family transporter n=1 Tax=Arcicella lustrica TaxID=2984196 RepID=A0ABU5SJK9_9BACT|nr:AEC family transporter [Arcicella sp. DC25W]MEA5427409.1 AEC family transporter [Arcicella sp. DC25W]